jgi:hypothetical protein
VEAFRFWKLLHFIANTYDLRAITSRSKCSLVHRRYRRPLRHWLMLLNLYFATATRRIALPLLYAA